MPPDSPPLMTSSFDWTLVYQQLFGPIPVGSLPKGCRRARRY
jgi:hypothetical protein